MLNTVYSTFTTTNDLLLQLMDFLENKIGWSVYDNISSTNKVFKTNGENVDKPSGYFEINTVNPTARPWLYWDNVNHTGTITTSTANVSFSTSYPNVVFSGDKNNVFIATYNNASPVAIGTCNNIGYLPNLIEPEIRLVLTSSITTGYNVQVTTNDDISNLQVGIQYGIFGINGEGRDWNICVNRIIDSNTFELNYVPRNYAAGAFFGTYPMTFGSSFPTLNNIANFYPLCPRVLNGLLAGGTSYSLIAQSLLDTNYTNPSGTNTGNWFLTPNLYYESGPYLNPGYVGVTTGSHLYNKPASTIHNDIFGIGNITNGVTTSSTINTLTDSSRNWIIDELVGKVLVIKEGVGEGQTRVIQSNTANIITLYIDWLTLPVSTSQYVIVDDVYRVISNNSSFCIREYIR